MSLSIVGLGVANDITEDGLKELSSCDEAFCEYHTMPIDSAYVKGLEKKSGKRITLIGRDKVEGDFLLKRATGGKKVCLLCGGDPLVATTHISLLIDARKAGIETKIIHNSSILSAACGKSGLQPYKFGKTVTVSYWRPKYEPTSPLLLIEKNLLAGMHTLALLDLDKELGMMDAKLGLELLRKMEAKEGKKVLPPEVVVLSRIGYPDELVSFGKIEELMKRNLGKPPFCICIPAEMHEMEREYLLVFGNLKK